MPASQGHVSGQHCGATLSLFSGTPAFAQTVTMPTATPHWCEDLGVTCQTMFGGRFGQNGILRTLNQTPPSQFLPPALSQYVLRCETARQQHNAFSLTRLHQEENPISGVINDVQFVPPALTRAAAFSMSGARFVIDCGGRHLQLRSDRQPPAAQLRLVRDSFFNIERLRFMDAFGHVTGRFTPARGAMVTAASCDVDDSFRRRPPRLAVSQWMTAWEVGENSTMRIELSAMPARFIDSRCFEPPVASAPISNQDLGAVKEHELTRIQTLEQYREALRDLSEEADFLRDLCSSAGFDGRYRNYTACREVNEQRLELLRHSFLNRIDHSLVVRFETHERDHASSEGARHLHQTRLLRLRRVGIGDMTETEETRSFTEEMARCREHICECRSGMGSVIILSAPPGSAVSRQDRNEIWSTNEAGDYGMASHPECNVRLDPYNWITAH